MQLNHTITTLLLNVLGSLFQKQAPTLLKCKSDSMNPLLLKVFEYNGDD